VISNSPRNQQKYKKGTSSQSTNHNSSKNIKGEIRQPRKPDTQVGIEQEEQKKKKYISSKKKKMLSPICPSISQ
jgi:hypothetical protein